MGHSKVAVLTTTPETVPEDYHLLLKLADYEAYLPKDKDTALKINISWHYWYPVWSTPRGSSKGSLALCWPTATSGGFLHACHNRTVVVSAKHGELANKH